MAPPDCLKKVEGGLELTLINMITPLPVADIPVDPLDFLEIAIDGKTLSKEEKAKIKVTVEQQSTMLGNIREFGTVAVGAKMIFNFPKDGVEVGKEMVIDVNVPQFNVNINLPRTVQ
jgi:hypothetical protein